MRSSAHAAQAGVAAAPDGSGSDLVSSPPANSCFAANRGEMSEQYAPDALYILHSRTGVLTQTSM